jgi:hypothetical protein
MHGQDSPGRDLGHLAQILGQVERRRQVRRSDHPRQHIAQRASVAMMSSVRAAD